MLSVSKLERQRTSGPQKRTKSDFMYCSQHLGASSRNPRRNPRCYKALCCDRFKVTSQLLSLHSQNLSLVKSLFSGFGKIKKGSWKFLKKLVVQPLLRQLLLPSTGERQLYLLAAAFEIPKSGKQ